MEISPSVVPPEIWIYGGQMDSTWEGLLLGSRCGEVAASHLGEAVFMALRSPHIHSPHTHPPTKSFVRGVGGIENVGSLLLAFLDTDSLRLPPLEQPSCVKCQEELCSWAPWPHLSVACIFFRLHSVHQMEISGCN